jgi:hypothetical protein
MKRSRTKQLLLAGGVALLAAGGAFGQQEKAPESLLPPGFNDPPPPREPTPGETPSSPKATPGTPAPPSATPGAPPAPDGEPLPDDAAAQDLAALGPPSHSGIEIPEASRRATNFVGPLTPANWGLAPGAFGNANGRFLVTLMGRLDAPLPSRWTSILLRRALSSQVPTPSRIADVDWIAERAWLLLRMGEADSARALVQSVDVDKFTPRMFTVAVQTALATGDPAALCPLVQPGRAISDEPIWPLADAMCAALAAP